MRTTTATCDIPTTMAPGGRVCGRPARMLPSDFGNREPTPLSVSIGLLPHDVCEACANLPLNMLVERLLGAST